MPAADPSQAVLATVTRFLRSFSRQGPLLVAVSGGSDSSALLVAFALALRAPEFSGFSLHAVTVDHGLRPGSGDEASAVSRFAARHGVSHHALTWSGPKPQTGLQAAARSARYGLLRDHSRSLGALAVLLGHTAGDQQETIAMRGARGVGEGLSGMAPAVLLGGAVWAFRPLLDLDRASLRAFLVSRGEGWVEDPSNVNPRFERARMRLSPGGLDHADSLTRPGVVRLADAADQAAWLERHARVACRLVGCIAPGGIEGPALADGGAALFKLAAALGGLPHLPPKISRERVLRWLGTGQAGRMTLGGTVFDRRRSGLYLYREARGTFSTVRVGDTLFWDGRFGIDPARSEPAVLRDEAARAGVAWLVGEGVPEPVARRAIRAAPDLGPAAADLPSGRHAPWWSADYRIAAHAEFVSGYEWPVASTLRHLFALPEWPAPPLLPALWLEVWRSINPIAGE